MVELKEGRYRIEQAQDGGEPEIKYYTAWDEKTKERCLISQITGRERIVRYLPELLETAQKGVSEEFLDCFCEDSDLYVAFRLEEGENLYRYLENNKPDLLERMELLQIILHAMLPYQRLPELLRNGLFAPECILITEKGLRFCFKADTGELQKRKEELLTTLFFPAEIKKNHNLKLLKEKIRKNVATDIKELIFDVELLLTEAKQRQTGRQNRKEKHRRLVGLAVQAVAGIGIVVGILLMIRQLLWTTEPEPANAVDITAIGTVQLTPEE